MGCNGTHVPIPDVRKKSNTCDKANSFGIFYLYDRKWPSLNFICWLIYFIDPPEVIYISDNTWSSLRLLFPLIKLYLRRGDWGKSWTLYVDLSHAHSNYNSIGTSNIIFTARWGKLQFYILFYMWSNRTLDQYRDNPL